jgi:hypothetical protein
MPSSATTYSCLFSIVANISGGANSNHAGALFSISQRSSGTYNAYAVTGASNAGISFAPNLIQSGILLSNNVGSTQSFVVTITLLGSNL